VPPFRIRTQELSLRDRVKDAARDAARDAPQRARELKAAAAQLDLPEKGRELRAAAAQLDLPWARSAPARWIRENFMQLVMNPLLDYYAARRATGGERLATLKGPVIMVANHASHMDTPVILSALPRRLRKRTAVAAAADYFYRNRFVAAAVSLFFNTVPIERSGGGGLVKDGSHLDSLLDDGWNLLLYPEGTRSRGNGTGRLRRGAAVLASHHNVSILPIRVTGTAEAMPPGQVWPKRLRGTLGLFTRRHRIEVSFGEPIPPQEDAAALIERVQSFFDANGDGAATRSPYRRRARSADAPHRDVAGP
jgi:1-acyl-sn-glycerol-3-phosphate acyltransferase